MWNCLHESLEERPEANTDHSLFIITLANYFSGSIKPANFNGTVLLKQFIEARLCV